MSILTPKRNKVLLIDWDAADWKVIHPLMDEGKMPGVQQFVEQGAMGNLATLHPVLSPMLWTSIATGKRPYKHGVHGFSEPTPDGGSIRPITNLSRNTKAVWNIFTQMGLRSNVVGWWPSHPAEPINGVMASNHFQKAVNRPGQRWPVQPGAVSAQRLIPALAELRVNPGELAAEHLLSFIPRAAEIDQEKDPRLLACAKITAECTSVHAVATWLMQNEPWDFMAVYLDAIDHYCHAFMRYHPPRQEHVPEKDFELYKDVVEAGYCYHDMMLRTLVHLAGEDTTVILMSDHGFHPDHLRPKVLPAEPAGPAAEHRDFGIFAIRGPGIKQDALLHGLTLLEITPTLLTLFGLPVGDDMDGHPAVDAFVDPPELKTIPSWDDVEGDSGRHPEDMQLDPVESNEAINQLVELGYIEKPDDNIEKAISNTVRELRYNLAGAYMDGQLHLRAAEILEELYTANPNEHRIGIKLAMCYQAIGNISQFRELVDELHTRRRKEAQESREKLAEFRATIQARVKEKRETAKSESPDDENDVPEREDVLTDAEQRELRKLRTKAHFNPYTVEYLRGCVERGEENFTAALAHFKQAETADSKRPGLHIQLGEAYLKLDRPADAEGSFQIGRKIDPENAHVHLGLARSHLNRGQNRRAVQAALKAVGLQYQYPMAHYCLGVGLLRLNKLSRAIEAFEVALSINPNFAEAHQRLAEIRAKRSGHADEAAEHERLAGEMQSERDKRRLEKRKIPTAAEETPKPTIEAGDVEAVDADRAATPAESVPQVTGDAELSGEPVVVVSGLPRSGTSMIMQLLESGGVPILTDGQREADEDNPRGYYELDVVKHLKTEKQWVASAGGMAVKVIAQLLVHLPPQFKYKIVFVQRELDEILASQEKMLQRSQRTGADISSERLRSVFETQLRRIQNWLAHHPNVETLYLNHRDVIDHPAEAADRINAFLGGGLDAQAMASVVKPDLYRQRTSESGAQGNS